MAACWALDSRGNLALPLRDVRGLEARRVQVLERLRLVRGTDQNDTLKGLPWKVWLGIGPDGDKGIRSALEVQSQIRAQLEAFDFVRDLTLNVTRSGTSYSVSGTAAITGDDGGTLELSTVLDPFATAGASPWYIITHAYSRPPAGPAGR